MKLEILFPLFLSTCLLLGTMIYSQNAPSDTIPLQETKSSGIAAQDSLGMIFQGSVYYSPLSFTVPDSFRVNDSQNNGLLFQMPVFIPDSTLTESMPVLIPPPVDEGMIIPLGQRN